MKGSGQLSTMGARSHSIVQTERIHCGEAADASMFLSSAMSRRNSQNLKNFFLVLIFAVSGARAAVPPAEKLLPADTLAFLTVPDWSKAQTNFSKAAWGQLFADPSMKAFKEKFFEKFNADMLKPLEKELDLKFSNFTSVAKGQFTIAVTQNGWDGRSDKDPGVVWIIDAKEKSSELKTNLADLRKKWTDSGKKMRTDKIRAVEFTTVIVDSEEFGKSLEKILPGQKPPPPPDEAKPKKTVEWVIGQSDSLLIVSDAAKDVEKVLAFQSGVSVPALADQAAFAANAPMLRDAQAFVWVNVKPIMSTLARRTEQKGEGESLLGAPSGEKILNALGLSGVQTIALSWLLTPEGSALNVAMNVPESSRKGLFNILAVSPKDASAPPFVPADAVKFSRWRIDLQKAWTTIENMLVEISPVYAGPIKLILDTAGKDKDPNFDFRKQLLANLGDDVITYKKSPRSPSAEDFDSPPSVTLIGSKNAPQLATSLKAITSIFPPQMIKYNEREFLGRTVYSFTMPTAAEGPARPLSYAASGGYVAFSTDPAALEEYLRSAEGNVKPLREFPGMSDAAQKVGGSASGYFSFENQRETARAAFETAKKDPKAVSTLLGASQLSALGMGGADGKGGMADWFDASVLPAYDRVSKYFHFNVSAINVSPQAITFKIFAPVPPQSGK
jgi:hypothetical protein